MVYTSLHIAQLAGKGMEFLSAHKKGIVYLECEDVFDLEITLSVAPSKKVEDFLIDGNFYRDDLSIEIVIVYNPDKEKDLYWMNWSLNEILAHEVCHYHQYLEGRLPRPRKKELPPAKYYLQSHEVEAQISGWQMVSEITGDSLEKSSEIWFGRNYHFHGMEELEWKKVIQKIFFLLR
jgi:uncharacterized protein YqgQ